MKTVEHQKPAIQPDHPVHELFTKRWSPRSFDTKPIGHQKLLSVFEAARWAASSFNEQPWRFLVTHRGTGAYDQLLATLSARNQSWAGQAPVLVLSLAKNTFSANGADNRHAWHDTGLAMQNISLQAVALGLYLRQMAGFSVEAAREAFDIPDNFACVSVFALGYPGTSGHLPEALQAGETMPQKRKPVSAFTFEAEWDHPLGE